MFVKHLIEVVAVILVCGSLVVCGLCIFDRGREFLRKLGRLITRDPVDAVIVLFLVTVFVAVGGSKPEPPPVVVQKGIKLLSVVQTPAKITFAWEPDDDRIQPGASYLIQERIGHTWETLGRTTSTTYEHPRFTIAINRYYRIAVDVTPAEGVAQ